MRNYINEYSNESGVTVSLNALSLNKPYLALLSNSGTIDWNSKGIDYSQVYFTIEFLSDGLLDFSRSTHQLWVCSLNVLYLISLMKIGN